MVIVPFPLSMTPGPNEVMLVPPDDRNGPSVTRLAFKIVWSKERLNCQDVSSVAAVIEMGIMKMSPTFLRTGTGPEPAVTIGTAWASAGQSTTLRRARVRTDRRSLRTVDLTIVDGRGLVRQLRYCTIVDAIFPPQEDVSRSYWKFSLFLLWHKCQGLCPEERNHYYFGLMRDRRKRRQRRSPVRRGTDAP